MSKGKPVVRVGDVDTGHGKYPPTPVTTGSPTTTVGGKPVARVGDMLAPHHKGARVLTKGDPSVLIDGMPVVTIGDPVSCGGTMASGDGSVVIGGSPYVAGPVLFAAAHEEFVSMIFNPATNTTCPEEREALLDSLNVKYEPRFPGDTVGQLKAEYAENVISDTYGQAATPQQLTDDLQKDLSTAYQQPAKQDAESLDIYVKDADGSPAGGLPYYAFTPDERERDGRLNAEGKSTEQQLEPGRVVVHVGGEPNGHELRQNVTALRERLQRTLQAEASQVKRLTRDLAEKPKLAKQWPYQKTGIRGLWNGVLGLLSAASDSGPMQDYQRAVKNAWTGWKYTDDANYTKRFIDNFSNEQYQRLFESIGVRVLSVSLEQLAKIGAQMIFVWEDHQARNTIKKFVGDFQAAQKRLDLAGGLEDATDDELAGDLLFSGLLLNAGAKLSVDAATDWMTHLMGIGSQFVNYADALKVSRQRTSGVGFTSGQVDIKLVRPEYQPLPMDGLVGAAQWIELLLKDKEGTPLADQTWQLRTSTGAQYSGVSNNDGLVRVDGISRMGDCEIKLPEAAFIHKLGGAAQTEANAQSHSADGATKTYVVQQGDTLQSIAQLHGLGSSEDIYQHPANAAFREKRPDPNVIAPGDELQIPNADDISFQAALNQRHEFVLQDTREVLRLIIEDDCGVVWAGQRAVVTIGSEVIEQTLDDSGLLELEITPAQAKADIVLDLYFEGDDEPSESFSVRAAHLDPVDTLSGIQARCNNLGFDCGVVDGAMGKRTRAGVRAFQTAHKLTVDGEPGPVTQDKLMSVYGC